MIFTDATLEGCELFRFRWSKKLVVYFGLYEFFFFGFPENSRPKKYYFEEINLTFYIYMDSLIFQSVNIT